MLDKEGQNVKSGHFGRLGHFGKFFTPSSHNQLHRRSVMAKQTTRRYQRVSHAQRVEVMILNGRGMSQRAIAREMNLNGSTIEAIINKWNQYHTLQDRPKIGRPHKLDDRLKRLLARKVQIGQILTATELVQEALTVHGITISRFTAQKLLHEHDLKARRTIRRPLLTREHKRRRLEFATAHAHWTVEDWKQVIFSDETIITARPSNTRPFIRVDEDHHGIGPEIDRPYSARWRTETYDLGLHHEIWLSRHGSP